MKRDICGIEVKETEEYLTADGICCSKCMQKAMERGVRARDLPARQLSALFEEPLEPEQKSVPEESFSSGQSTSPHQPTPENQPHKPKKNWFTTPLGIISDIFAVLLIIAGIANIKGCDMPVIDGGEHYITMVQECRPGDGSASWRTILYRNFENNEWEYKKSGGEKHVIFTGVDEDNELVEIRFKLTEDGDNVIIEPDYLSCGGKIASAYERDLTLGLLTQYDW